MAYRKAFLALASLSAIASMAGASSAAAEWIFKKEDKAFGEKEAVAMSIGDSSIVFFRCNSDGLQFSLATPEDWGDSSDTINKLGPQIIVSIDGAAPVRFDIQISENQAHKILAGTDDAETVRRAAGVVASAKKRIDIGLEFLGKRYHASKLSAAGATKKIQAVLDTCAQQAGPNEENEKESPDSK